MYFPNKKILCLAVLSSFAVPSLSYATNGMFLIGPGTKSIGMGGVSMTMTHDTLASAINPAIMAHTGNRFDIGGDLFKVQAESTLGGTTVESLPEHMTIGDGLYIMPNLGASWSDGDVSYGFTMLGLGGGGSGYIPNLYNLQTGADATQELGVSLVIMNINPTIAMKLDDNNSVGATLIIGMQVFKAYGLGEFMQFTPSSSEDYLTNQGTEISYGAGIRLGWLGNFMNNDLTLGASYTSRTYMSKFEKYKELFAEQGDIDTPGNIGIGASYKFSDKYTVAMDIHRIFYEDIASISNAGPRTGGANLFPVDEATNGLGQDEGLGFGWHDQTVIKAGLVYRHNDIWTWRTGWNYGKSPIDEEEDIIFNITAPATTQHHFTLGGTYMYDTDIELSFSYMHAFEFKQYGPTYIGNSGEIGMSQDAIGGSFAMKF
jgi:long-chain fatty acid transport protein